MLFFLCFVIEFFPLNGFADDRPDFGLIFFEKFLNHIGGCALHQHITFLRLSRKNPSNSGARASCFHGCGGQPQGPGIQNCNIFFFESISQTGNACIARLVIFHRNRNQRRKLHLQGFTEIVHQTTHP